MKTKKEQSVDINPILEQNNLTLVETGFFRNKKTISLVENKKKERFILKTGGIETHQIKLMQTAKEIESELCFKVPGIIKKGAGWILMEEISGKFLNDYYDCQSNRAVEISKKISDDYQKVLAEFLKGESAGNLLEDGKKWLFSRLCMWSGPIIEAGFIDFRQVEKLEKEFETAIKQKDEKFFGWFHGNIIGDHIKIANDGNLYLLDLHIVPRAGKNYYDFLRALDFMFLKSEDNQKIFKAIPRWTKEYLSDEDWEEVKLVFAFRNIGTLGWDALFHKVEYTHGNMEEKKQLMLKFIKREY
ncbi:hypothetical protein J7J13_00565 [bacterium]|nr:hypothetical protein [bacterium]